MELHNVNDGMELIAMISFTKRHACRYFTWQYTKPLCKAVMPSSKISILMETKMIYWLNLWES